MSSNKRWVVTTSNEGEFKEITKKLTQNGFVIDQILEEIGCVTGTASERIAKKLHAIPGVTDVSPESDINIGPPGNEVTW